MKLAELAGALCDTAHDTRRFGFSKLFFEFTKWECATICGRLVEQPVQHVWELSAQDALTDDQWKRVKELETTSSVNLAAIRSAMVSAGTAAPPAFTLSSKAFWRAKARNGALPELQAGFITNEERRSRETEIYNHMRALVGTRLDVACGMCGAETSQIVSYAPGAGCAGRVHHLGIDRRMPGSSGGRYEPTNMQAVCCGCNSTKWWYSDERARVLIGVLAEAWQTRGANKLDD